MGVGFAIGFSLVALVLGIVSIGLAGWAVIDTQAFRRSTHHIQYVNAEKELAAIGEEDDELNKTVRENMSKLTDELASHVPMQNEVI